MHSDKDGGIVMKCPKCEREMRNGYLFGSKDGAFSFASKIPSAFENAKSADGFVKITGQKLGGRTSVKACCCEECGILVLQYK